MQLCLYTGTLPAMPVILAVKLCRQYITSISMYCIKLVLMYQQYNSKNKNIRHL